MPCSDALAKTNKTHTHTHTHTRTFIYLFIYLFIFYLSQIPEEPRKGLLTHLSGESFS